MTAVLWFLVLAPIGAWVTAIILVRAALQPPPIRLLSAIAASAVLGALAGSLLAPLAIAELGGFRFDPPIPGSILVLAVLLFSLPGPCFLVLYLAGWFNGRAGK